MSTKEPLAWWWDKKHVRLGKPILYRLVFELGLVAFSLVVSCAIIYLVKAGWHG